MIYITTSKAEGKPCEKVYSDGRVSWYYCQNEEELFASLLNLISVDPNPKIYNVYGKRIYIPNDAKFFEVKEKFSEAEGIVQNYIQILKLMSISKELKVKRNVFKAKFAREVNAEDLLKLGIRIEKPIRLPNT
ncbi:MAG: hypothetical protein RRE78_10690 [Acidianus sp.]|jgi:hypothetical protein|nr:hypothetical protein [Acidianus sp.]